MGKVLDPVVILNHHNDGTFIFFATCHYFGEFNTVNALNPT